MSETANFESAQALFCAIADKVGKNNIDKVLNLETYKTYPDFRLTHITTINDVFNKKRIDVDVGRKTIEEFLTKKNSWYISSVNIAKKLLLDLHKKVDKDFKDITAPGYQRNYLRGDKEVFGNIKKLYNIANSNSNYNTKIMKISAFGDINKWNPADIYYASNTAKKSINKHLNGGGDSKYKGAKTDKAYSFDKLNKFIAKLINSGDLLPLSLKKATREVKIVPVNFDIDVRTKMIDGVYPKGSKKIAGGLWHAKNQSVKTGWLSFKKFPESSAGVSGIKKEKQVPGIPKEYGEPADKTEQDKIPSSSFQVSVSGNSSRSSEVGKIEMRHDRSTNSWKVDYYPAAGQGRGGSVVSDKMFSELLAFVDSTVSSDFQEAYTAGKNQFKTKVKKLKEYRKDIEELNRNRKKDPKLYGDTLFHNPKRTSFDYVRGELSSMEVTNKVHGILQKWFKANSEIDGDEINKVDDFIRILYRYVTSRSETSAKFVIAK